MEAVGSHRGHGRLDQWICSSAALWPRFSQLERTDGRQGYGVHGKQDIRRRGDADDHSDYRGDRSD